MVGRFFAQGFTPTRLMILLRRGNRLCMVTAPGQLQEARRISARNTERSLKDRQKRLEELRQKQTEARQKQIVACNWPEPSISLGSHCVLVLSLLLLVLPPEHRYAASVLPLLTV